MKANRKFVQADDAVSPVIAVILMVAITVVLAATVFVLVSNIGQQQQVGPTANISATADSTNKDILLKHVSGDALPASEWKISITTETAALSYTAACSAAFNAGDQIRVEKVTAQGTGTASCTDSTLTSTGSDIAAGKYHVVVIHTPSSKTLLDIVVEVF